MTTGIPLIGGLLNGILTAIVLTVGMLSRRFNWNATVMWLTFSLLATVTTTLGPPGFYKIGIGLIAGLLWDVIYKLSNYKWSGLVVGGLVGSGSIMISLIVFLNFGFGEDTSEALAKYKSNFWIIIVMNLIITFVGIFLGRLLYNQRLKNLVTFKNING